MSSYMGKHAELYDVFYADKPYEEEAAFVHQMLQQYCPGTSRRLLELACGTGTHALEFEKFGHEIVAVDYSEDMLAIARQKADKVSSSVDFRWADMREMDLAVGPFDAAICLFDSIGYVETNEAIMQVLQGIRKYLRPSGLFIFEFWHAGAMYSGYDPVRVRRWSISGGDLVRISETELEYDKQLARVAYTIYDLRQDGTYTQLKETQTNRYFSVQEIGHYLASCGFKPIKWFSGFTENENINRDTWHIVAVSQLRSQL